MNPQIFTLIDVRAQPKKYFLYACISQRKNEVESFFASTGGQIHNKVPTKKKFNVETLGLTEVVFDNEIYCKGIYEAPGTRGYTLNQLLLQAKRKSLKKFILIPLLQEKVPRKAKATPQVSEEYYTHNLEIIQHLFPSLEIPFYSPPEAMVTENKLEELPEFESEESKHDTLHPVLMDLRPPIIRRRGQFYPENYSDSLEEECYYKLNTREALSREGTILSVLFALIRLPGDKMQGETILRMQTCDEFGRTRYYDQAFQSTIPQVPEFFPIFQAQSTNKNINNFKDRLVNKRLLSLQPKLVKEFTTLEAELIEADLKNCLSKPLPELTVRTLDLYTMVSMIAWRYKLEKTVKYRTTTYKEVTIPDPTNGDIFNFMLRTLNYPWITKIIALDLEYFSKDDKREKLRNRIHTAAVVNYYGFNLYYKKIQNLPNEREEMKMKKELMEILADGNKPIIVGQSLENDLALLGLNIPDDERRDLAFLICREGEKSLESNSLQLAALYWLGLKIQSQGPGKHDPLEDARASMALYRMFENQYDLPGAFKVPSKLPLTAEVEDRPALKYYIE